MVEKGKMQLGKTNYLNEVILQGRISGKPELKKLPSGDKLVQFRLVVDRKLANQRDRGVNNVNKGVKKNLKKSISAKRKREVDTLDIGVWRKNLQPQALTLIPEQFVKVRGAIRRSFWTTPTGLASRYQIDADQIQKL